jgi:hypothetical protein
MTEDVLLELETPAPIAESLDNIKDLARKFVPDVGKAVEGLKGSAQLFENGWQRLILNVANGRTTEIQAARPQLLSAFETRLGILKDTYALAKWLFQGGREGIPDPDVLLPEVAGMERLKADMFDRWQTADDLEDLAARDYPLTTEDLDRIGPNRQPPASWYSEESKPF